MMWFAFQGLIVCAGDNRQLLFAGYAIRVRGWAGWRAARLGADHFRELTSKIKTAQALPVNSADAPGPAVLPSLQPLKTPAREPNESAGLHAPSTGCLARRRLLPSTYADRSV
jgi:hypothetical protein